MLKGLSLTSCLKRGRRSPKRSGVDSIIENGHSFRNSFQRGYSLRLESGTFAPVFCGLSSVLLPWQTPSREFDPE